MVANVLSRVLEHHFAGLEENQECDHLHTLHCTFGSPANQVTVRVVESASRDCVGWALKHAARALLKRARMKQMSRDPSFPWAPATTNRARIFKRQTMASLKARS